MTLVPFDDSPTFGQLNLFVTARAISIGKEFQIIFIFRKATHWRKVLKDAVEKIQKRDAVLREIARQDDADLIDPSTSSKKTQSTMGDEVDHKHDSPRKFIYCDLSIG